MDEREHETPRNVWAARGRTTRKH